MASSATRRLLSQCLSLSSAAQGSAGMPGALERIGLTGLRAQCGVSGLLPVQNDSKDSSAAQAPASFSFSSMPASLAALPPRQPSGILGLQQPNLLSRASGSTPMVVPAFSRGFASLGARRPMGLGLGLGSKAPMHVAGSSPVRTYLTEGQLLGNAFLLATDIMFWSGLIGAVVFRRNLIVMLLATEIVMLACNLNFLFASAYFNDMTGVIMSITITTIAACETAIGLALCVTYFHLRSAVDVEALNFLK